MLLVLKVYFLQIAWCIMMYMMYFSNALVDASLYYIQCTRYMFIGTFI